MSEENSRGRPTTYEPQYCKMLIEHMAGGYSFESFASVVSAARSTIYKWLEDFPEFSDAKKVAFENSRFFWETIAIQQSTGECDGNPTMAIFNLKNRFPEDWRDKKELSLSKTQQEIEEEDLEMMKDLGMLDGE